MSSNPSIAETVRSDSNSSVRTLLSSAVGAGVLSLPYAFRCAGWAGGLFVVFAVAAVESFTLYVLSRYTEQSGTKTYTQLVSKHLGKAAGAFMCLLLFAYLFGSSIAYLIILGDSFQPIAAALFGSDNFFAGRTAIITLFSGLLSFPLCFPTSLHSISKFTRLTTYGLMAIVGVVLFKSLQIFLAAAEPWDHVSAWNTSFQFFDALPILVFGFQCHCQVVTVFEELDPDAKPLFASSSNLPGLEEPVGLVARVGRDPDRPRSRKLASMTEIIICAIGATAIGYSIVGASGYLAFPTTVTSNVLNSFSGRDPAIQVARAIVGIIQLVAYPVNHFPARAAIKDLFEHFIPSSKAWIEGRSFNVSEVVLFYGASLLLALSVHDLGSVFKLIGGTGGGMLIFAIPGALLVQYSVSKCRRECEDMREPLLLSDEVEIRFYHWGWSKLFWSGILLILLSIGLFVLTIYTVINPQ